MTYDRVLPAVTGVDLSRLDTHSLLELEEFFQQAVTVEAAARLISAFTVHKIISEKLYYPEYDNMTAYFQSAPGRLNVSGQTASHLFYSAEFYLIHHEKLLAGGFRIDGDFSKLRHAAKAAEYFPVQEVIDNVCSMSFRDFVAYAYPRITKLVEVDKVDFSNGAISLRAKKLVSVSQVKKILESGRSPYLVGIESPKEKKLIEDYLKKIREE